MRSSLASAGTRRVWYGLFMVFGLTVLALVDDASEAIGVM